MDPTTKEMLNQFLLPHKIISMVLIIGTRKKKKIKIFDFFCKHALSFRCLACALVQAAVAHAGTKHMLKAC